MTTTSISLGPFELTRPVGRGGMAEVWRARHRRDGVDVAVKVITGRHARDPGFQEAFDNEVRAVAALRHPGVIEVYDYGRIDEAAQSGSDGRLRVGSPWLAMSWVPHGTLEGKTRFEAWGAVAHLSLQILAALAHAHARGVIHRDIKPGNLLVVERADGDSERGPRVVLSDFGIARATGARGPIDASRSSALATGTPSYMAPEQIRGRWREQGPWTDLYALGCLVYRLVTGRLPFVGEDPRAIMRAHLADEVPELAPVIDVPTGLDLWLRRILARSPGHRYQRAADAARDLLALGAPASSARAHRRRDLTTEATTRVDLPSLEPLAPRRQPQRPLAVPGGRIVVPETWRRSPFSPGRSSSPGPARDRGQRNTLRGVGLGLFGLRTVPLIDRDEERDRLWQRLLRAVDASRAHAIMLTGDAGVGKSRLAQWLVERAHELGVGEVLRASHSPTMGPFDGLVPMLASHLQCHGMERAALEEHLLDYFDAFGIEGADVDALVELIAPTQTGEPSDGKALRLSTPTERHVLIWRTLRQLAGSRSIVLWLDDVQWGADAVDFTRFVLTRPAREQAPCLLLLTAQAGALAEHPEIAAPLERMFATDAAETDPASSSGGTDGWPDASVTARLAVGPLAASDHERLVDSMLGLDPPLVRELAQRTAGRPLFAVQLIGDLVEREVLVEGVAGFDIDGDVSRSVPADIDALWQRRLAALLEDAERHGASADEVRTQLELAACLGMNVDQTEWRAVCDLVGVSMADGLLDQLGKRSLAQIEIDRWTFAHGLLRDSILHRAEHAGRARRWHRCCARMLRERYGDDDGVAAARIGRHLLAAGQPDAALEPLLGAARVARGRSDFQAVLAHLEMRERATSELGLRPADERCLETDVLRATTFAETGRVDAAQQLLDRVEMIVRTTGREERLPEVLCLQGLIANKRGELDRTETLCQQAEALSREQGDDEWLARSLRGLAGVGLWRGEYAATIKAADEAASLFAEQGDDHELGHCLVTKAVALRRTGRIEDAIAAAERSLECFERAGSRYGRANALNDLGESHRALGQLERAEHYYEQSLAGMEAVGSNDAIVMRANLGCVLSARDEFARARVEFERALEEFAAAGTHIYDGYLHTELAVCDAGLGLVEMASDRIEAATDVLTANGLCDAEIAEAAERAASLLRAAGGTAPARRATELARAQWLALGRQDAVERLDAAVESRTQSDRDVEPAPEHSGQSDSVSPQRSENDD